MTQKTVRELGLSKGSGKKEFGQIKGTWLGGVGVGHR